ncbi:MAG TPA: DNA gyrase subunit A [Candidatus Krumholzibacteriaceae bacterium]|nr:DNA gyrase subunit A [Candidatus Krumholzibacteriaceae bacterium]
MQINRQQIKQSYIEDEMRDSYLDYSMSVIVSRALPDARDGLKPVHRRILLAMNDLNLAHNRAFRKSAKVTGDVTGNYHPHGTASAYDAIVRMAQHFSLRYPLVEGQGNFGSIDGDPAAAERYTEVRMEGIAEELLEDIKKETVEFGANYDNTRQMALVLPAKIPNLLINGASGIAVGMATNIPPHNLVEIIGGLKALLEDPELDPDRLCELVPGPDFPTGGIICGREGIREAYKTGRGKLLVRAKANIETAERGKSNIIVTEIPYQTNKAKIIKKTAELVRSGSLSGISDIRDESDKDGMRIVIQLKRDAYPKVVLNKLYKKTQLQTSFGIILLALIDGIRPKVMSLKQAMKAFLDHREEVVTRRTRHDLKRAEERAHILEGYKKALDNIDAVIKLIKKSASPKEAKNGLENKFGLTEIQAQAILDMKLQRLTGLERKKIDEEYLALIQKIEYYKSILESRTRLLGIISDELDDIKERFGDERRTAIIDKEGEFEVEDFIAEEDMIITITHSGYIKRIASDTYRRQKRGGKGVKGMGMKDKDFIEHLFIASTHTYILFFTDKGQCHWLKVHEIPRGGRLSRGKAIVNLLQLSSEERITAFVSVDDFSRDLNLIMATKNGRVKKTPLTEYSHPRKNGIIAIDLKGDDSLVRVEMTTGNDDIILAKKKGKAIRFNEKDVRVTARATMGVKGVSMDKDDEVVEMVVVKAGADLLTVTENGYGKRTDIKEYRNIRRGGKGVISILTGERNGNLLTIKEVFPTDEIMMITKMGKIIKSSVSEISVIRRNAKGVRLINLDEGDLLVGVTLVAGEDEEDSRNSNDDDSKNDIPAEGGTEQDNNQGEE